MGHGPCGHGHHTFRLAQPQAQVYLYWRLSLRGDVNKTKVINDKWQSPCIIFLCKTTGRLFV